MKNTIVQTLKTEDNCFGFYYDGAFQDRIPSTLKGEKTYHSKYCNSILRDEDCVFLDVYLKGLPLSAFDEGSLLLQTRASIEAHRRALRTAKVATQGTCIFEILPTHLVEDFFSQNESIYTKIVEATKPPPDYDILHKAHVLSSYIQDRLIKVLGENDKKIVYDIYSSATGRFTTKKGSFPILNLKKDHRAQVLPKNDLFIELDYNGAEVRTLLSLCGTAQPEVDIHEWNNQCCLNDHDLPRDTVKRNFFAWLYNPNKKDLNFEKYYDKTIYKQFYSSGVIRTPFNRFLPVDQGRALNYLLQSTTADIVTEKAYNILKILEEYRSDLSFTVHDSIVLDVHRNDYGVIERIIREFENTPLGKFKSNIKIGKNFGNMREASF